MFSSSRARYLAAAMLLATSACAGNRAVPMTGFNAGSSLMQFAPEAAVDTTSILKKLTKNVLIGSTVDATNGDKVPHGLVIAPINTGKLKKGQLVTCNFSNKSNAAGKGTTIEILNAKAGSKPTQFAQNAAFKGCAALAISKGNSIYGAAFAGKLVATFDATGKYSKTTKSTIVAPFGDAYACTGCPANPYPSLVVFASDASTGSILRIDTTNGAPYGITVIATGFAVNKKAGTAALGPSGLLYNEKNDTLYIVDGVDNTVVAFKGAGNILLSNAVVVQPGGKTFKYAKKQKTQFASVAYSGTALKSPVASALLPNGNLIIANTVGNSLVEMTPTGQILDTKVVDTKSAPAVFGLVATGTTDANTSLFYTDANTNTVQELKK